MIPTRGARDLDACLASLRADELPGMEVIVVDNDSRDVRGRAGAARVIRNEENVGFALACNQGIDAASGELVLLLNDDTVVEPGALPELVAALERHAEWGACQAKLLLLEDPTRLDTAGSFLTASGFLVHRGAYEAETRFTNDDEIFAAKGAALLIRRGVLDDVGAFDPDYFAYFEESDLCWRIWLAGHRVGFAADARIRHRLGATATELPSAFVQFHSFKNRICTLLKNLGAARLAWMLPYHLLLCAGLAAWFLVRGKPALTGAILRAIAWNATRLPQTLRKRRHVQELRRVSDAKLMPRVMRRTSLRTLFGYARRTG